MTLKSTLPLIVYFVPPLLNLKSWKLIFKLGLSPASLPITLSSLLDLFSGAFSKECDSVEAKEKHLLHLSFERDKYLAGNNKTA